MLLCFWLSCVQLHVWTSVQQCYFLGASTRKEFKVANVCWNKFNQKKKPRTKKKIGTIYVQEKNTAVTAKGILLLRRIWKTALCVTLSIWRSAKGDDLSEKSYSFALDHEGKAHELLEIWKTEWRFFRFRNLKALLLQKLPTKTNLTNDYYSLKTCIYQK